MNLPLFEIFNGRSFLFALIASLVLTTSVLADDVGFVGNDFRVNSYTNNNQSFPEIAMSPEGQAVVVWESIGQDGSNHAAVGQRYGPDGLPVGDEFIANTTTANTQSQPSVAMDADGSFVVFWRSRDQDGSEFGAYAQRYSPSGERVGNEFRINVATDGDQDDAFAAFDGAGNMLVVYVSGDISSAGVFARRYDTQGIPGDEFRINETTQSWQQDPQVAGLTSGFVVTWESRSVDSDRLAIMQRRYTTTGLPLTGEQQVNTTETEDQKNPAIARQPDDRYAIAWESIGQDGSGAAVIARTFAADGAPISGEIILNETLLDDQENPDVAIDGRGGYVAIWDGDAASGGSNDEIWGRRFLADGTLVGDEFQINTRTNNRQVFPAIAGGHNGRLLAVWHSWTEDGNGTGMVGRRLRITSLFEDRFED
ncbi:MAG: hypothetical protein AAGJ52_02795 [Pseudomonadota bacterium]